MGLMPDDFDSLSGAQFDMLFEHHLVKDARRQEPDRMIFFALTNLMSSRKRRWEQLVEDWPLYTDKQKDIAPVRLQEMQEQWDYMQNVINGTSRPESSINQ